MKRRGQAERRREIFDDGGLEDKGK